MVRVPMVQSAIGDYVASALSEKLGTAVSVGRVDVALFNRIIIDDVTLLDQKGKRMLQTSRLSAKISLKDLTSGNITISSAQIFSPKINLYKASADTDANFQFVIDSLASKDKDTTKTTTFAINSLVIRHGQVEWNQLDAPRKQSFDTHHMSLSGISSHIIINHFSDKSFDIVLKKLAFKEASGLWLRSLSLDAKRDNDTYHISQLHLALPHSSMSVPQAALTQQSGCMSYDCEVAKSRIALNDITPLVPFVKGIDAEAELVAHVKGSDKRLNINSFSLRLLRSGSNASALSLLANASIGLPFEKSHWHLDIKKFGVNNEGMALLADKLPDVVARLHDFQFTGKANGVGINGNAEGSILSGVGNADVVVAKDGDRVKGHVKTETLDLGQILNNDQLKTIAADISANGDIASQTFNVDGTIGHIFYNGYSYQDINVKGNYNKQTIEGDLCINDANVSGSISGKVCLTPGERSIKAHASISNFSPSALGLFKGRLANATYQSEIYADIRGNNLNDFLGRLEIRDFSMKSQEEEYALDSLALQATSNASGRHTVMHSDFGTISLSGKFDYASLKQGFENVIVCHLPSITKLAPFAYKPVNIGNFSLDAQINDSRWAKMLFGIPLTINAPLSIVASMNDSERTPTLNVDLDANDIEYDGHRFKNLHTRVATVASQLGVDIALQAMSSSNAAAGSDISLTATAGNDKINAMLGFDNHALGQRFRGSLDANVKLGKDDNGLTQAMLKVNKSQFSIGDSLFTVYPSNIVYSKNHLDVNDLKIGSSTQGIVVDGCASATSADSLTARLYNVDVSYIQNIINFHSVDFDGALSGTAHLSQLFGKPSAHGNLTVERFKFMNGRLGTLSANVAWNNEKGQIDIDALASDTLMADGKIKPRLTDVKGYVSIKKNYIDLGIGLHNTRAEFVGDLCSSFLSDVDLNGNGELRLWGDLKAINLTGDVAANGSVKVTPLGTRYTLPHGRISFIENEIIFKQDSIYDPLGSLGIVGGAIHHRHLGRMSYDIDIAARNLLAFNLDDSDGSSFYGKVSGTGTATIKGKSGEVAIDVNMTPSPHSEVVYDISSPESLASQDFITWMPRQDSLTAPSAQSLPTDSTDMEATETVNNILTNIRLTLAIKATPDATLKIIMDKQTGDYITLNGSGDLRATYFNKGGISIFGTYTIDHGVYDLTIQNIIKKQFQFADGGTIIFGGDPYNASLNLMAQYPIASVSLADLQLGRSFSSNNTRVTCLMDITGTPESPKVTFGLDFPTMSSDAKQMVSSLINGEEEMNQQVLYLLAVGRFYSKGVNNAGMQSSQTSLAMQSIVSGQLSQQINSVLSSIMKTSNWNFGANISTGDEGFNNADYEGLLSGRMLNNRLLFNGQFGYRDNANATTSFIGDFDLRYLIFPNGNLSVHVYNQANDRYFTRNTLNTQGVGFILKKDFSTIGDLLNLKKTRKIEKNNGKVLPIKK